MSKIVQQHIECPCKSSSDAYCVYDDGHGHCFSCSKTFFPSALKASDSGLLHNTEVETRDLNDKELAYFHDSFRNISERTIEKYNVLVGYEDESRKVLKEVVYNYQAPDYEGKDGAAKIRIVDAESKRKRFSVDGPIGDKGLYGKHVHDPGSKASITIFEGQDDALSGDDTFGDRSACLSVQSASTAYRDCKKDRDYINSFDKVIFFFDNDVAGKESLNKCVSLFDFNKVFVVSGTKHKDASDYLQAGEKRELNAIWKAAKRYTPDGIISTFSEIEAALESDQEACIGTYPFEQLQHNLFGLHRGEVIVFKAPEGVGKTETFRAIEHHLLKTTNESIAIIHLEEDDGTTVKAIATYELQLPCVLPDSGVSKKDIFNGFRKAVGDREDRVYIHSHFGADDPDIILDNIRFLVTSCGCSFVFLDHISMLVTGLGDDSDERRKLDYISTKLKLMAKELGFCLIMISHVNDEGQTRGSRNITKIANTVVHIFRDKVNPDPIIRNTTTYTIEKARLGGRTGPGGQVFYNSDICVLREMVGEDFKPKMREVA